MKKNYLQVLSVLGFILAWQIVGELKIFDESLFPTPGGILKAFVYWHENRGLETAIYLSLRRVITGFVVASIVGVSIGLLMGYYKTVDYTLGTIVRMLQPIPGITWVPLAILWFGSISETAKIYIVLMGAVFPILINTSSGVQQIPPIYLKTARSLGARGLKLFSSFVLPAALPSIISGMRVAWAFSWRALISAEMILAFEAGPGRGGIGGLVELSRQFSDINLAGMVMVILAMIGMGVDRVVFGYVQDKILTRWGLEK